ncbi:MAG TPA: hypothetical protein VGK67_34620 [Myxococcales bacterium]|jgi:hypothetical protein
MAAIEEWFHRLADLERASAFTNWSIQSMACIHLLCRGALNVRKLEGDLYESGDWDLAPEDAHSLVGGTLFLHEKKTKPSYFGGLITQFRVVEADRAHPRRVIFTLSSDTAAKGKAWEGDRKPRAWTGGILK